MRKLPPSVTRIRGVRYPKVSAIPPKVWLDNKLLSLEKSLKLKAHDIQGFNWGPNHKGGSQLALAICLEIYPELLAMQVYVAFRKTFLDGINGDSFDNVLNLANFNAEFIVNMGGSAAS